MSEAARIATALERIADALDRLVVDRDVKPEKPRPVRPPRTREQVHADVRSRLRRAGGVDR